MEVILPHLPRGAVLPGAVALLIFSLLVAREALAGRAGLVALLAGGLAGFLALEGLPPLQPKETVQWTVWATVIAGAAGLHATRRRPRMRDTGLAGFFVIAACLWILLNPLHPYTWEWSELVPWALVIAAAWGALWILLPRVTDAVPAMPAAAALSFTCGCAAAVLGMTGTLRISLLAGVPAAALGGIAVAAWRRPGCRLGRGPGAALAVLLPWLWLHGLLYSETPPACLVLLSFSCFGILLPGRAWVERGWPTIPFRVGAVTIPALAALGLAWRIFAEASTHDDYGY